MIQKTTRCVENGYGINGLNNNPGVDINPTVSNTVNETIHYEYDNQGNLLKDENIIYSYDAFNRTVKA